MTKKKKKKKRNKNNSKKKYVGIIGYLLKLIDEKESRQSRILGWILNVIIITSVFTGIGYLYNKYQDREKIEQQIEIADTYFTTEQYQIALEEYKTILNSFNRNEHSSHYSDLLNKIGKTLLYSNDDNRNKTIQSLEYLNKAKETFTIGSEKYNYNLLSLTTAYFELYNFGNKKEYLDKIHESIIQINSKNQILNGLKYFYLERYYLLLSENTSDIIYLNKAKENNELANMIFTSNLNPEMHSMLNNDRGNIEVELYHLTNSISNLENSKKYYSINYNNNQVDDISRNISMFGLGHYYKHKYEIDSIYSDLFKGKDLLEKTLVFYDSLEYPIYHYSSKGMLAQIEKKAFDTNNDINLLLSSIKNLEDRFNYYKVDFHTKDYYENNYQLGKSYYQLALINKNSEQLAKAKDFFEKSNDYYTFEKNKSFNIDINSKLANIYKILYEKGSLSSMKKIIADAEKEKSKEIVINADNLGASDLYYEKFSEIMLPPEKVISRELTSQGYKDIADKYYSYNWNFSNLVNDKNYRANAAIYKSIDDDETRLEAIEIIKKLRNDGPYATLVFKEGENIATIQLSNPTEDIHLWK